MSSASTSSDGTAAFDPAAHLHEITAMVRRASELSLDWYRRLDRLSGRVENKKGDTGFDPVTEADRAVETDLRNQLAERFAGHQIVGEEFGTTGDGPVRWTIDPIDGTRAFITGQPMWGTLLGLQIDDRPVAGWMHVPVLGETYVGHGRTWLHTGPDDETGSAGDQATSQATELATSGTERLDEAIVLCTHPDMFAPGPQAEAFARLADTVRMVRYSGDCLNYGLLAMGLADSVVENGLAAYDIVPLIPIVEGAGGVVTDLDGRPPLTGGYVVASANATLHQATLDLLNG